MQKEKVEKKKPANFNLKSPFLCYCLVFNMRVLWLCGCAGARVRVVREGCTEVRRGSYGGVLEARAAVFLAARVLPYFQTLGHLG
ncbi:hypothetical protein F383_14808 [Gossypium arboreum]|uniref:Uncharacterized protein n=1 Tax=Gossypium arboreum TaxID=29729 RepID=A0A0B0PZW9_GOSAR|nr:hypothetical protein F383_14808 [Gossypium arboreum]